MPGALSLVTLTESKFLGRATAPVCKRGDGLIRLPYLALSPTPPRYPDVSRQESKQQRQRERQARYEAHFATLTEAEQFFGGYRRRHCDAIGRSRSCVMLRDRRDVPNCGASMSRSSDGGFRHGDRH
jgi:hypothetical protein